MSRSIQYIKSAYKPEDYPPPGLPEVIITGRSNAGKSSLINAWMGSKVAHVSQTPGKTRLLNFFNVEKRYILVDTPGYGYAVRSNDEQGDWKRLMENYLSRRETLKGVILVMDARRDWAQEEVQLKDFCDSVGRPMTVVLTKVDKISKSEQLQRKKILTKASMVNHLWLSSALKKTGLLEMDEFIYKNWIEVK